jgi:transposase-like protein
MTKQRRHVAGAEKVAILKRHLLDKVPISDLCDELGLYPNQVYAWLKELCENGLLAFDNGRKSKALEDANARKVEKLEAKLQRRDAVLAELMQEHTLFRKELGEI